MHVNRSRLLFLVLALSFIVPRDAYAYIDPGSTSLLLQGAIGAIAAILVIGKAYWRRAIALFRRPPSDMEPPASSS